MMLILLHGLGGAQLNTAAVLVLWLFLALVEVELEQIFHN